MGRKAFIRRLIAERGLMGYRRAPLELDANKLAFDLCEYFLRYNERLVMH